MANDTLQRPLPGGSTPKKADLTKPARISQRRSLQPPPPAAVQAAKQKSLPPPPPPSSIDVDLDMEDDDDATIVRDRSSFEGFFNSEEQAAPNDGQGSESPWALPPVAARPEFETLADDAVVALESNASLDIPEQADNALSPSVVVNEANAESRTHDLGVVIPRPTDFEGTTESHTTEEIDEVEEVTVAGNDKPSDSLNAMPTEEPSSPAAASPGDDDLDALFGRARKPGSEPDNAPPAMPRSGGPLAPPPPPSLHPSTSAAPLEEPLPPLVAPLPPAAPAPPSAPPPPAAASAAGPQSFPAPLAPQSSAAPAAVLPDPVAQSKPPVPPPIPEGGSLPPPPLPPPPGGSLPPPLSSGAPAAEDPGLDFQDDEPTQIFDRGSTESQPPASLPLPSFASQAPSAAPAVLTFSDPPPIKPVYARKSVWGLLIAAIVVAAMAFMFWPRQGRLVVAVAGPNGTVVDGITVSLGDDVVCTNSPCEVSNLEPKSYLVTIKAEGFEPTAPQAVIVEPGEDTVHNVKLESPAVTAPSGLDIPAETEGLSLFVDGKAMGTLPQKLLELEPGEHKLRVSGGDRYDDAEKKVTVIEGQVLSLQPFTLKVKKGRATIEAGENAEQAEVKLDGKTIKLPHTTDLDTGEKHVLTAAREGFGEFEKEITFDDGKAEANFTVELDPDGDEEGAEADESAPTKVSSAKGRRRTARRSTSGKGTLNINSVPSAMVILDGKPIGKTPRMGIKVKPGAHSIVFVSSKGRKRATTKVGAGKTKTVSVRF